MRLVFCNTLYGFGTVELISLFVSSEIEYLINGRVISHFYSSVNAVK